MPASPTLKERERVWRIYDTSCSMYSVAANQINAGSRCMFATMACTGALISIIYVLVVSCPELCDLIGVLKFLNEYMPDVYDPLTLSMWEGLTTYARAFIKLDRL